MAAYKRFAGSVSSVGEIVFALVGRDGCAQASGSPGRLRDTQKGDNMKSALAAAVALIVCLVGFNSANAQGAAMKTTPTTKILAIGTINPGFEQSQVFAVLPEEVRETVDLYLDGKIEQ